MDRRRTMCEPAPMRPRTHALSHPAHGQPECTPRALVTGILIGALLTPCNVYSGLKIGWSFNMSIAACLLSFGYWRLSGNLLGSRAWGLYENNINQTTASAAAVLHMVVTSCSKGMPILWTC